MTLVPGIQGENTLYGHLQEGEDLSEKDLAKAQKQAIWRRCTHIEIYRGATWDSALHVETWRLCIQASHENVSGQWEKLAKK